MIGPRFETRVCFICGEPSTGFAFTPHKSFETGWTCTPCSPHIKEAYSMSDNVMADLEAQAREAASMRGGAYLDGIGKTDLATLAPEEWETFLGEVLTGYRDTVRSLVSAKYEAPF